jgi:hypothetical protein
MHFINATKLHRKSGGAKPRDLQFFSLLAIIGWRRWVLTQIL